MVRLAILLNSFVFLICILILQEYRQSNLLRTNILNELKQQQKRTLELQTTIDLSNRKRNLKHSVFALSILDTTQRSNNEVHLRRLEGKGGR